MATEMGVRRPAGRAGQYRGGTPRPARNRASTLWASLPKDLVIRFRPMVGQLTTDMIREIQLAIPAYARPLTGHFGAILTAGVEQSVLRILDTIGTGSALDEKWAEVFRQLGRTEFNEGRSLDALQTAYRVGGRVAWRHVAAWGQQQRLPTAVFTVAAEAIFAYVDEISALSIRGYTEAQAESADLSARRRRKLAQLILSEPSGSRQAIARLAKMAGWRLPESLAVVALESRDDHHEFTRPDVPDDVLMDLDGETPFLIVSEPDKHAKGLQTALDGRRACIGPTVKLADAATSLRWARRAICLVTRGIIPNAPITWCADHLSTLWLLADEFLVAELIKRRLAPLANLTAKQRARVADTMLAWLDTRGSAPEIAARLDIHPQTVRYRMRQVEQLFGPALENPDARLDLEIALRARSLLSEEQPAGNPHLPTGGRKAG
ncbi:PucR-like helix-turn-helix protein [Herbihabitans rhizosphaerae]|uniref:PucR-like helix-turn-helix protein n=1 Tax=Herbihabitans rhizosphaerae TaxID=1872711 RepID=A0A4Q7KHA4_9PSEU|nr:helix-turn-helix domain-containing protein [Herbihabitans rhizosphaerae]RZS32627.1 PucR-like helix-turn-helix protein [Herbihabitans rhizosphaerae]